MSGLRFELVRAIRLYRHSISGGPKIRKALVRGYIIMVIAGDGRMQMNIRKWRPQSAMNFPITISATQQRFIWEMLRNGRNVFDRRYFPAPYATGKAGLPSSCKPALSRASPEDNTAGFRNAESYGARYQRNQKKMRF